MLSLGHDVAFRLLLDEHADSQVTVRFASIDSSAPVVYVPVDEWARVDRPHELTVVVLPGADRLSDAVLPGTRPPERVRCGDCSTMYVADVNILDHNKPIWLTPRKKRGGCQHDHAHAETLHDGRWVRVGDPIDG